MGMNYFLKTDGCVTCGRGSETIHLGKSSVGWKFTLQANDFMFYRDWKDMQKWLKGKKIVDEAGNKIKRKDFTKIVEKKQNVEEPPHKPYGEIFVEGYKFLDTKFS